MTLRDMLDHLVCFALMLTVLIIGKYYDIKEAKPLTGNLTLPDPILTAPDTHSP
jgi:hypothetical protein